MYTHLNGHRNIERERAVFRRLLGLPGKSLKSPSEAPGTSWAPRVPVQARHLHGEDEALRRAGLGFGLAAVSGRRAGCRKADIKTHLWLAWN